MPDPVDAILETVIGSTGLKPFEVKNRFLISFFPIEQSAEQVVETGFIRRACTCGSPGDEGLRDLLAFLERECDGRELWAGVIRARRENGGLQKWPSAVPVPSCIGIQPIRCGPQQSRFAGDQIPNQFGGRPVITGPGEHRVQLPGIESQRLPPVRQSPREITLAKRLFSTREPEIPIAGQKPLGTIEMTR